MEFDQGVGEFSTRRGRGMWLQVGDTQRYGRALGEGRLTPAARESIRLSSILKSWWGERGQTGKIKYSKSSSAMRRVCVRDRKTKGNKGMSG